MFCRYCGEKIPDESAFCPFCGEATAAGAAPATESVPPVRQEGSFAKAGVMPGFSSKINDPAVLKALKKNKKGTAIFGIILVLAPIVVTFILGMKNGDMSMVKGGLFVSFVFLLFTLFSGAKKKSEKQWDGVVASKQTEERRIKNSSEGNSGPRTETVYVITFLTDKGKKKKLEESTVNHYYFDYLNVGDKVRFHPQFNLYYEKFDKSRDTFAMCPVCGTVNDIARGTCSRCGVPVIK